MSKKDTLKISKEESDIFRESVTDVKPLRSTKRHTHQNPPKTRGKTIPADTSAYQLTRFVESDYVAHVGADEILQFSVSGVQLKLQKKLRQGRFNIDRKIDLHGLTAAQSGIELDQCIKTSICNANRCILIIHGRGSRSAESYPVLKSHVNEWLRQCPSVIAFVSALPKDGGPGAMYVLLKQTR